MGIGAALVSVGWDLALDSGVRFWPIVSASLATALMTTVSARVMSWIVGKNSHEGIEDLLLATAIFGAMAAYCGLWISIGEELPSKHGPPVHVDRRYSLIWLAVILYMIGVYLLVRRRNRTGVSRLGVYPLARLSRKGMKPDLKQ